MPRGKRYVTQAILENLVLACNEHGGGGITLATAGKLHTVCVHGDPVTEPRKAGDAALWLNGYLLATARQTKRRRR